MRRESVQDESKQEGWEGKEGVDQAERGGDEVDPTDDGDGRWARPSCTRFGRTEIDRRILEEQRARLRQVEVDQQSDADGGEDSVERAAHEENTAQHGSEEHTSEL